MNRTLRGSSIGTKRGLDPFGKCLIQIPVHHRLLMRLPTKSPCQQRRDPWCQMASRFSLYTAERGFVLYKDIIGSLSQTF